jgi:Tfp pilus assembly pilus retraction ATPase PilT
MPLICIFLLILLRQSGWGGYLMPVKCPSLTPEEIRRLIDQLLTPRQREVLEERKAVDLAVEVSGMGRFRINSYYQRENLGVRLWVTRFIVKRERAQTAG